MVLYTRSRQRLHLHRARRRTWSTGCTVSDWAIHHPGAWHVPGRLQHNRPLRAHRYRRHHDLVTWPSLHEHCHGDRIAAGHRRALTVYLRRRVGAAHGHPCSGSSVIVCPKPSSRTAAKHPVCDHGFQGQRKRTIETMNTTMNVAFCGGGTAGHASPMLAMADALAKSYQDTDIDVNILMIGTAEGMEATLSPDAGYEFATIEQVPMPRSVSLDLFSLPFRLRAATRQARKLLREHQTQVVVGVGGYAATPVYLAA